MTNLLVIAFGLALAATVLLKPGSQRTLVFLIALTGLIASLAAASRVRPVGDAREYVLMSINLSRFEQPSATPQDLEQIRTLFPGVTADDMARPELRGPDGRQDFPHFWVYSLLAAPFVAVARLVGAHPVSGFLVLNVLMLLGVAYLLLQKSSPAVALLVAAGPILWWVDKAHAEILTFSMITVGLVSLPATPWWSILVFGVAATQNPPLAAAMFIAIVYAVVSIGWRDRRVWLASSVGLILAALHPLYFYSRLRVWSGLYEGVDRHWPSWRELMVVMFDPNLGIFVHDPLLLLAVIVALADVVTRPRRATAAAAPPRRSAFAENVALGSIALFFLFSFTQTTNFNSGGTPAPSRYGLWLVPFAVPILARVSERAQWVKLVAAASVAWCVWAFAPELPDQYLQPTTLAADLWRGRPELDNPLAEVFAERAGGHEPARPPVATPGCEKVLLVGDGTGAAWPTRCTPVALPAFCQAKGVLCYANRTAGVYRFVEAQSPPAWRTGIERGDLSRFTGGMLAIVQAGEPKVPMAIWNGEGWSYPERLPVPAPDVVSREWRWMGDRADIGVMSSEPMNTQMKIVARSLARPRRLRVAVGDTEVATLLISTERGEYQTSTFTLPRGSSVIALESLDGSETPAGGDGRRLSIAVFRVELAARK